jgi:DNA-binding GntR family transcriptional regulator
MKTKVRPLTMVQTVAKNLKEKILNREIAGGEPLRQDAIAKEFGISIIPVREALIQLESEGLVQLVPRRGAIAIKLTRSKALEWIRLRLLIEVDLIGDAIDNMTEADADKAEEILERYNANLSAHTDIEHWSETNWEFHEALYAPANRPETMDILAALHKKCDCYVRVQLLGGDHIERAQAEHKELLDLYRQKKKRMVKALLDKHIAGVEYDLKEEIKSSR